jgi:cell wall-associated NlpC family hydrolase
MAGVFSTSCNEVSKRPIQLRSVQTSLAQSVDLLDSNLLPQAAHFPYTGQVYTGRTTAGQLLTFARTLMGTPYVWGSVNPDTGLDCSGFVNCVFKHYRIQVPRTSIEFSHLKGEVPLASARPGDIILFTGTDSSTANTVGHMGMVERVEKGGQVYFIHSSSGPAHGVTVTPLNAYYKGRFVKLVRLFPDSGKK